MSVSVVPSSAVALIEKTLLSELDSASLGSPHPQPRLPPVTASQLTKDLAALLKDLASGNVDESKTSVAKVQQDIQAQTPTPPLHLPLDNLLTQISTSLNSTNSTSASLQDLDTYFIQNGQGTGNIVNTTA